MTKREQKSKEETKECTKREGGKIGTEELKYKGRVMKKNEKTGKIQKGDVRIKKKKNVKNT